ncbi:DUF4166 domain-containing protein [Wenxinia marina]|uniref:DUF4166 domain-containing protein n=1 Tax=Wenxinia marina DSM 24838 TaxID=1123501 RepID=A0A0D0NN37_9RHOB|nr:DUF4166 domain-containing protein [Wenxinia marina]KIQ69670.1 hypothetical protein Wenmar_02034 [Wenxinia marina DSM 24838]GGL60201.1 hypothetical protein GCM10011392_13410 [Wenxinia marina]
MIPPFRAALGAAWGDLPAPVRAVHGGAPERRFAGRAEVIRAPGALAGAALRVGGFPPATNDIGFTLHIAPGQGGEVWRRRFGAHETISVLAWDARQGLRERFGAVTCVLAPRVKDGRLTMEVVRAWAVRALPLPAALTPASAIEVGASGDRYLFDIAATLPGGRALIRYRGWLAPA